MIVETETAANQTIHDFNGIKSDSLSSQILDSYAQRHLAQIRWPRHQSGPVRQRLTIGSTRLEPDSVDQRARIVDVQGPVQKRD